MLLSDIVPLLGAVAVPSTTSTTVREAVQWDEHVLIFSEDKLIFSLCPSSYCDNHKTLALGVWKKTVI